jgi:hypothetical protein
MEGSELPFPPFLQTGSSLLFISQPPPTHPHDISLPSPPLRSLSTSHHSLAMIDFLFTSRCNSSDLAEEEHTSHASYTPLPTNRDTGRAVALLIGPLVQTPLGSPRSTNGAAVDLQSLLFSTVGGREGGGARFNRQD